MKVLDNLDSMVLKKAGVILTIVKCCITLVLLSKTTQKEFF